MRSLVLALLCAAGMPRVATAQPAPLELTRLTGRITLDGVPDEAAWQAITPLPLSTYAPVFRGTPTQRTEIRVAYDDDSFYAAGWFHDTDPKGIRINSLYRDRWNGDDALAIYIDAFNDKQNSKWFGVTPAGMRFDVLVSDDGSVLNDSWDTFWDAKTTVTDSGWFAEVRIPFSSLGFHVEGDKATMGLTVTRLVSRLQERVTFPEIDPKFEFRRPSLAREVVLRGVRSETPLYVTPYVLGSSSSVAAGTPETGYEPLTDRDREVGLDVRYPITSQLTFDLTVNTDFAQVEADDQQVNFDRFPLFYPERRRFFQEGSSLFDFNLGGEARLFNSRRIGLAPDLTSVPVLGGLRLVGRAGGWDVGALAMQTKALGPIGAEHFRVARVRHGVLNRWSSAGLLATSYASGGRHNAALGADALLRLRGNDYLTLRTATASDVGDSVAASLFERSHYFASLQRRTGRGLAYTVSAIRSGREFRPELGYLQRRDYRTLNAVGNYFVFTDRHPVLKRVFPGALAFSTWRNGDGGLESGQYALWVQWETKDGGGGWLEPKWFLDDVLLAFPIGPKITIPAGQYDYADLQLALSSSAGRKLRASVDLRSGTYFDGRRTQVILTPTWNASRYLELSGDYRATSLSFASRGQSDVIHVGRLRVGAALDARHSGNALVQYSSTTGRLDMNVRLRRSFSEGTDLWLVYNEGLDMEREVDPHGVYPPRMLVRTLILKYSHTLTL